ncbi:MAG TPA: phosphatase PAP2 family protein [Vicinamibacteria bacterium]|nr:phosphatase PAP2 family protein [Vicinamibacteria bacterium]
MEGDILLWVHGWAGPLPDAAFWLSSQLADLRFCVVLVGLACLWHLWRGERTESLLWLVLGLTTLGLEEGLKLLMARPRPHLWVAQIQQSGFAFPSGHALASATFYPLLARDVASGWPRARLLAWGLAVGLALFIGVGRLYLGVHWPSDVLAGWALGAGQTALGLRLLERRRIPPPPDA